MKLIARSESISKVMRFPLQASKALMSNSKFILNHLFVTEGYQTSVKAVNFDQILKFFDTKAELNIILAGYVSECLGKLMDVYYFEICKYLFDNSPKFSSIIQHLYNTSVSKNIIYPIIFKADKDFDLETSVLEKKLEREQIEKLLRPQRTRLLKDIWNKYFNSDNVELVTNILMMFKDAVNRSPKEENCKVFLHDTLYSKPLVNSMFQFMLNTEVS